MPSTFSETLKDMIKRILIVDPQKRFTVSDIRGHPWYNTVEPSEKLGTLIGKNEIPVDEGILEKVCKEYQTLPE